MNARHKAEPIEAVAARWAARIDAGALSAAEADALARWSAADVRHDGALIRAQAALRLLDSMDADGAGRLRRAASPVRKPPTRRSVWGAAAAGVAAIAGGAALMSGGDGYQTYRTGEGEIRRLTFPGGTEVIIDAHSQVRARMSAERQLARLDAGRAWFAARHGSTTPLDLIAGGVRLLAVRAAFSAERDGPALDLLVSDGRLQAWADGDAGDRRAQPLVLTSGTRARLVGERLVQRASLSAAELARAQAWKSGRLGLDGETVREAVATFNRYNRVQLVIASPTLSQQRIVGFFHLDDPGGFAEALRQSYGAPVRRVGDQFVVG
jgi:transmembrane sensor